MRYLPSLWEIDLSGNNISDVTFLLNNKNLKEISLIGNPIENFSVLSELSRLQYLEIQNCGLTSFEGIEKFSSLKFFYATDNKLDKQQKVYYKELLSGVEHLDIYL